MRHIQITSCLLFLSLATTAAAHQPVDGDIHLSFGWMGYQTHELNHHFDSQPLVAPGLLAEGDLNSHGGGEVSIFYLNNPFSVKQDSKVLTEQVKRIYISMGYRYWFTTKFAVALAFFSSYTMGDSRVMVNEFNTIQAPHTSASDATEYGADLSVAYEAWHKDRVSFVIDTRYAYSVTAKRNEDSNHYGVLLAFKYFIQSRDRPPDMPPPEPPKPEHPLDRP